MRADLVARLRADVGVAAAAGTVGGRPAIDWIERKSDAETAFPAATLQVISPGRQYDQDGPSGLSLPRVRIECFGLSHAAAAALADAILPVTEAAATYGATRFHRGKLLFERDFNPEDLGSNLKVFRNLRDFQIPNTPT